MNGKAKKTFGQYALMGAGFAAGAALVSTIVALAGMGAKRALEAYQAQKALAAPQQSAGGYYAP